MKLSSIAFASLESYHDVPITNIDLSEAEGVLTEERKKYLRTAAKEKSGQASGVGALSSAAKGVYSIMVKQAARPSAPAAPAAPTVLQTHVCLTVALGAVHRP
jgi:hypothetical protein